MFQFCIAGVHAQFVTLSDSSLLPAASTACQVSGEPTGVQGRGTVRVRARPPGGINMLAAAFFAFSSGSV